MIAFARCHGCFKHAGSEQKFDLFLFSLVFFFPNSPACIEEWDGGHSMESQTHKKIFYEDKAEESI